MTAHNGSRVAGLLLAGALTGLLVGCGSSGSGPGAVADTGPADIIPASSDDDLALPVDGYGYTAVETGKLLLARELLAADCLQARGIGGVAPPDRAGLDRVTRSRQRDLGSHGNKRRYGVTDADTAASYGYHLPSTVDGSPTEADFKEQDSGSGPVAGCLDQAAGTLAGAGSFGSADLVRTISWESYKYSLGTPELAEATKQWTSCMQAKGYRESSLLDAGKPFDLDATPVAAQEKATASADVACKREVGVVDTWQVVERKYQETEIAKHAKELAAAKTAHDDCMKRVADVIARHG